MAGWVRPALLVLPAALFTLLPAPVHTQSPIVIRGTTVIDITDGSLEADRAVVITGNRITAIAPDSEITMPRDAVVVEAAGTYLLPGLWDMHAHGLATYSEVVPFLSALIANGVTGIRDPQAGVLQLEAMVEPALVAGTMHGPVRLIAGGNLVDGPNPVWEGSQEATTPARGRAIVDSLAAVGAPFIKTYSKLRRDTYLAIVERSGELGLPVVGHVPMSISAADASDVGQRSIEHMAGAVMVGCTSEESVTIGVFNEWAATAAGDESAAAEGEAIGRYMAAALAPFDEERCRSMLRHFADNGTWLVPTLIPAWGVGHATDSLLAADPRTRYVPRDGVLSYWQSVLERRRPTGRQAFERIQQITSLLEEQRVPLLVGTDMPAIPMVYPGFSIHDEMRLLVESGLSPLYVLQGATLNPARFLNMTDSLGVVAEGMLADLLLLDANPLDDITNTQRIRAVMANGHMHSRADLDEIFEETAALSTRRGIGPIVSATLDKEGLHAAHSQYLALAEAAPDTIGFTEWELVELGFSLVDEGRHSDAAAVFGWNIRAYADSPYAFASFGDALVEMGRREDAAAMYRRAAGIAREQRHPSLHYFESRAALLSKR